MIETIMAALTYTAFGRWPNVEKKNWVFKDGVLWEKTLTRAKASRISAGLSGSIHVVSVVNSATPEVLSHRTGKAEGINDLFKFLNSGGK
jgi:hypothetical protein